MLKVRTLVSAKDSISLNKQFEKINQSHRQHE